MTIDKLIPSVSALSAADKLRLAQIVLQQLAQGEREAAPSIQPTAAPFDPRRVYGSAHQSRQDVDHDLASSRHCAENNPLKGSVTFEKDIVSPLDLDWDAAQ